MTHSKEVVYCYECGSEISPKAEICPDCGVNQPTDDADMSTQYDDPEPETRTAEDAEICGNRQEDIQRDTWTCPHCGYSAKSNLRKRAALIGLVGLGASVTGVGLIIGVPLLVWAMRIGKRATKRTAATTTTDGGPVTMLW